jgi:hypothetical protein
MARDIIMNLFKLIVKWNNPTGVLHKDNISVGFYPAEDRTAMENWAAWYVGSLGTFDIEETEFLQYQDNTGVLIVHTSQQKQAEKYVDTHTLSSVINNATHPEVGEYVAF